MEKDSPYFYNKLNFPYWKILEENHQIILDELLQAMKLEGNPMNINSNWFFAHPHYVDGKFDASWKTYTFLFFGLEKRENIKKCPKTYEILLKIPELITAQFSLMLPHTHITPHTGYSTIISRNHLPLIVPSGNQCGIRVGDETHHWKKGELVVFDDSYEHEAWNNSDEHRVVLMFDVAKPNCGYNAKEICRYKIERIDDPFLLEIASKETWVKWYQQGFFDENHNIQ